MRYELAQGRVQTWSLETHLVDHCNLRCANCCQLSPHTAERFLDPASLARDLERIAKVIAPRVFKFTGGEPTLHPQIAQCLASVRASGIAPRVQVTTNGTRLADIGDAFFEGVDAIKLSLYPSAPLPEKTMRRIESRCAEHGVQLEARVYESFQRLNPRALTHDEAAAQKAFTGCWLKVRCHLILDGRFHPCSRPPKLQPFLRKHGIANTLADDDGVPLDHPQLLQRVLALLEREEPLASCRHCLGASGDWAPHRQLSREEISSGLER